MHYYCGYWIFKWVQKIGYFYLTYNECEQWKVRKSLRNNPQSEINEENKPKLQKTANKTVSISAINFSTIFLPLAPWGHKLVVDSFVVIFVICIEFTYVYMYVWLCVRAIIRIYMNVFVCIKCVWQKCVAVSLCCMAVC